MDSSIILISDDEDCTESSLTSTSITDFSDIRPPSPSDLGHIISAIMNPATPAEIPTCTPPVYETFAPTRKSGRNRHYYMVFIGDQPGCYRNWADAGARVTNYPGSIHQKYDTYEQALAGWRQHCRAYHKHPAGFVDGTLFLAPDAPTVPKTPPPITPPPAKINTTSFPTPAGFSPPSSPIRTPSRNRPSGFEPEVSTPQRRNKIWAIHSPKFNSVVSSSTQADRILATAMNQGEEVEVREVDGVAQAEDWFSTLTLD
ncbi:hypothetical protein C8R42DRAFT_637530 [Lentinula raphanica]|nr:hypothetical protein C8R42DRAFT_648822 [Lentinula raphanica]KAJ3717359.1 hypothetical protein C8R42DRAFT_644613 [Lentinula raphanica]KAJ3729251.1 hypothetical protein C8R42DRAFT_637530 [Lentinula raphanica]